MKNKADISLEIMKRIMAYEKKKLRLWYEVVVFVLFVVLIAELFVGFDLLFDIQERASIDFGWILGEDFETMNILIKSVLNIWWEELPWMKISVLFLVTVVFVSCVVYVIRRSGFKRIKAGQINKYERTEKS